MELLDTQPGELTYAETELHKDRGQTVLSELGSLGLVHADLADLVIGCGD